MATPSVEYKPLAKGDDSFQWRRFLPVLDWLPEYTRTDFTGDLIAGIIVAVMLIPQGMAYALLAGLPPQVGLYASIAPLIIYGLLGTSRALAVGPVAMVSLMVASGIGSLNPASTAEYILLAVTLALMIGIIQIAMGVFRVGFLVNFLSHPVLSGFTSAAALVIGFSQLKHLLGFEIPRSEHFHEIIIHAVTHLGDTNVAVLALGAVSIGILLVFKFWLGDQLESLGVPEAIAVPITKIGPLVIVLIGSVLVWQFNLHQSANIAIVGEVPMGLPPLSLPSMDVAQWQALLPIALTISVVSYMESITVAKALASKRRQKVDANQELIALGAANVSAAATGGFPVTGGFSRSMVNFTAGARTGLASVITAGLVLLTVVLFTPLFYYLPNVVLASIIMMSVASLIDLEALRHAWAYNKADALSLLVTFVAVLELGIETGILLGAVTSIALYLWRTSRPHVAVVGQIGDTEEFRNVLRHETTTYPDVLALRVDESLYFPNAQYLEDVVLATVADHDNIEHFVLVCNAVNVIDTSALEVLEKLHHELHDAGIGFHMAEVKGPVMDRLRAIGFVDELGKDHFHLTTYNACRTLCASLGEEQAMS